MVMRSKIIQCAYVVNDLENACARYNRLLGVGPFLLIPHVQIVSAWHDCAAIDLDISLALAQAGDIQVELIQQHTRGPSAFRDMYPPGSEGFHHVAVICDDYDEDVRTLELQGTRIAMQLMTAQGMRVSFADTRGTLGHMVELYESTPGLEALYQLVRETAQNWDGRDLLRPLG